MGNVEALNSTVLYDDAHAAFNGGNFALHRASGIGTFICCMSQTVRLGDGIGRVWCGASISRPLSTGLE